MKKLSELNLNHLYYFHVTASRKSLTRAAEFLNLSQAALSIQIKKLEDQLGTKLFTRSKQRLSLSEQGDIAFRYTTEIFKASEEMLDTLNDRRSEHGIKLQIGYQEGVTDFEVSRLIRKMQIDLNLVETSFFRLELDRGVEYLAEFKVDIFISTELIQWPRSFDTHLPTTQLFFEEPFYFVYPNKSPHLTTYFTDPSFERNDSFKRWAHKNRNLRIVDLPKTYLPLGVSASLLAQTQNSGLITESLIELNPTLRKSHTLLKIPEFKRFFYLHTIEKRIKHPVVESIFNMNGASR